jgi:hypothetical protein
MDCAKRELCGGVYVATWSELFKRDRQRKEVVSVKVSTLAHKKAVQLERFQAYSSAKSVWGKDQKLLQCNILQVPTSKNYTVLLAMGRNKK